MEIFKNVLNSFKDRKSQSFTLKNICRAFTLAEVLITISVIGIVAILTIPLVSAKWKKVFYLTALKKKYVEFTQIVNLSVLENGVQGRWDWSMDDDEFIAKYFSKYVDLSSCEDCWLAYTPKALFFEQSAYAASDKCSDLASSPSCVADYCNASNYDPACFSGDSANCRYGLEACPLLEKNCESGNSAYDGYCDGYFSSEYYQSKKKVSETPDTTFKLNDGTIVGFTKNATKQIAYFYFDLNGVKSPNKYGADKFVMVVSQNKVSFLGQGETDLTAGDYGCSNSGNRMYCGAMILKNDWEYPDNYPGI